MFGPWAFEAQAVVTEHVLTGPLSRYRQGSLDELGSQVVLLKLCVSNALAGSIIGRGGHNRDQLQLASGGARIQLSRPNELYPGTPDRVLVLTGALGTCITALFAISGCLGTPGPLPLDAVFMAVTSQWKLILPTTVCGYILGAGGRTMRSITSQADANVSISAEPDRDSDMPRERIATISGGCIPTLRAMGLVMDKLLSRPFVEPGEPPFEGQFPSSRVALLARTGLLRNPPSLLQQHMPPHVVQQQQQHQQQQPQQQPQQHVLQQATLAPAPGQHIYTPGTGGSTFFYVPLQQLQPGTASVVPVTAPLNMAHAPVSLRFTAGHGAVRHMSNMSGIPMPTPLGPPQALMATMPTATGPSALSASQPAAAEPAQTDVLGPRLEVSIEVPENRVGLLIGRGGETLHSMQRLMNVSIHIARRPPATTGGGAPSSSAPVVPDLMRRVTISGARNAVNVAHAFILQRLNGGLSSPSSAWRAGWGEGSQRH